MKKLEPNEHLIIVTDEELLAIEQVLSPAETPVVEFFEGTPTTVAAAPSGTYTATHYVAPYASVSGATSDEDTVNGTAYASATSSGTPCTLAEAMANATAGDKVQCAAGVYIGTDTADVNVFTFKPTNAGTSGNEIVFFAQYPASTNYGSTELYSEIRRTYLGTEASGTASGAAIGAQTNYIILDGFYVNEVVTISGPTSGVVGCRPTDGGTVPVGCQFRRFGADRRTTTYNNGYNGNVLFAQATTDLRVVDWRVEGGNDQDSQNDSCFEFYNCVDPVIEYNTLNDVSWGIFLKTEKPAVPHNFSGVTVRYNKISCLNPFQIQTCRSADVYQNLFIQQGGSGYAVRWANTAEAITVSLILRNNTIYGDCIQGALTFQGNAMTIATTSRIYNNIAYLTGATNNFFHTYENAEGTYTISDMAQYNYNLWYDVATGSTRWKDGGLTNHSTFSAWQTAMAAYGTGSTDSENYEASSLNEDPQFTTPGTDFTLQSNAQNALSMAYGGGAVGCYITGSEEIGLRASPAY